MEPVAARGVAIVLMCAIASVLLPESIYDDINPDRHLVVVGNQLPLQNQISSSPHRNIDTTIITTQNPSQMSDYDLQDTERLVTERLTTSRNLLNSGKHNTFSTQQQKDIEELETLVKSLSHQLDDVRLEATKRRKERENERIRQENLLSEELLLKRRQEQEELRRKQALELQYKERMAALTRQIDRLKSEIRQESQYLSDRELDQKRDLIYQLQLQINRMREESTLETTVLPIITTNYMIDTAYSWKESTILLWDSFIVWIFGTNELTAVLIQLFMWIVTIILLFIIIYYSYYFNAPTTIDLIDDSNGSEAEIHQEVNEETIVVNETEEINRLRRTIDGLNSEINRLSKSNANTPMRTTVPPIYLNTNNNNNTSNGYHNNGTPYKSTTTTTYSTTSNLANNSFHNNGMYTSNGIHSNEITKNGVHRNGIHSNGVYSNGIHSNGNHVTENENSVKLRDNLDEEDDELSNYYLTNSTSNLIDDELYEINNNNNHINDGNNNNNDKYSNTSAERVKRDMEEQSKSRRDFMKRYESIDNITINETQSDVDLFDRYIDNDRLSVNSFLSETADYYKPFNTRINNRLTTATSSISPRSRSKSLGGSPSGIATPSGSLYNNDDRSSWLNITSTTSKHNHNHECSDDGCKCNDLSTAHGRAHHRQSKSPKKVPGKSPAGTPRKWKL